MHILLIHGMGRSPLSMTPLARWLRRAGHSVELLGYVAAIEPFDDIVRRVHGRMMRLAARDQPYVVIGHSLGGLLARAALVHPLAVSPPPAHLIMLGTPNSSPRLARRLGNFWPYRLFTGESGARLARPEYFASLPAPSVPYTIIAGTGGRRDRLSVFGGEPNDGIVAVSETRSLETDQPVELPAYHTFLMNNKQVRAAIQGILERVSA